MPEIPTPYTADRPALKESSEELRARIPGWGADLDPVDRPAYPREQPGIDTGAHWDFAVPSLVGTATLESWAGVLHSCPDQRRTPTRITGPVTSSCMMSDVDTAARKPVPYRPAKAPPRDEDDADLPDSA